MPEPRRESSDGDRPGLFATTHWSAVFLAARREAPGGREALEQFCQTYWYPLYAFARRQGFEPGDAEDFTQGFFARLLERGDLERVAPEKGRLRSYLLAGLKNFIANERERGLAKKRGGDRILPHVDKTATEELLRLEAADTRTPDLLFEKAWARALLNQPFNELESEYAEAKNVRLYQLLRKILTDSDSIPLSEAALELGMSENAVKQAFHRFRQRYRTLVRAQISRTVPNPDDVDDEMRYLIAVLRQ